MVVFLEGDHSAQDEVLRGLEQVFVQYISTLGFRHLLLERLVCVATLLWIMDNFSYYFVHKQTDRQMSVWLFCFFFFLNPFYKSSSFDLSITYGQHNIIAIVFCFFFSHILDFPSPDFAASAWYRPQPQQYWFEDWFCFQFALPSHIISASDILYIIQVRHKYYCIIICHYHSVSLWFLLLFNRVLLEDFSPFFCPLWAWFKATMLEGFCTFAVFWPRLLA